MRGGTQDIIAYGSPASAVPPGWGRYLRTESRGDVLVVTLDDPSGRANKTSERFKDELDALLTVLETQAGPAGLMFRSAKSSFGVGGDIAQVTGQAALGFEASFADSERIKALFRRLERLPIPSVALIEGTAAGGSWELALACNARLCLDDQAIRLGLPEVAFGLVPGAGGMARLPHMVGLKRAGAFIAGAVLQTPREALADGLLDGLAATREDLAAAGLARIAAIADARRAWDRDGHAPKDITAYDGPVGGPPGAVAPRKALTALAAIARVAFDQASAIESRCFAECATSREARALIGLGFHDRNLRRRAGPDFEAALERVGRVLSLALEAERAAAPVEDDAEAFGERLMLAQVAAALRLLASDDALAAAAMNIGSVEGGGFPGCTGGVVRHVEDAGPENIVARLAALAARHGDAFVQPFDAETLSLRLKAARHIDTTMGKPT
jgi:3-hydroxyacyl-CoA dehydrogenase/enoyl-CoA hydratase/3-hydroxybutyryl-CoA epimerase